MENLLPRPAEAFLIKAQFSQEQRAFFHKSLMALNWQQLPIRIFGKKMMQPRLTAWYGAIGLKYSYSGLTLEAQGWTKELLELKSYAEKTANCEFNSVLCNWYRDGSDSMSWHSDDEKELGPSPCIASFSFGATRKFSFRPKKEKTNSRHIRLSCGDLLIMKGETQRDWQHQVPKQRKIQDDRINLTFRKVLP